MRFPMGLHLPSVLCRRNYLRFAIGIAWMSASCAGLAMLAVYDASPGNRRPSPSDWPAESKLILGNRDATLIMFVHPHCPCTRASLGELEKIVAHSPNSVTPWVVYLKPAGPDESWDQTDLLTTAAAIPGVRVVRDLDGVEARRFHATTSGQTLLYSHHGNLVFNGGITVARGHAGDNPGRSAIESYLQGSVPTCHETPVFGCPIALTPDQK
jgi:hypothetical protein